MEDRCGATATHVGALRVLRKGNDWRCTPSTRSGGEPVQHALRRLIEHARSNAEMERHYWVTNKDEAAPVMRYAI